MVTYMQKHAGLPELYHKLNLEIWKFTYFSSTKPVHKAIFQQVVYKYFSVSVCFGVSIQRAEIRPIQCVVTAPSILPFERDAY